MSRKDHAAGGPADDWHRVICQVGQQVQDPTALESPVDGKGAVRFQFDTRTGADPGYQGRDVTLADGQQSPVVVE
jgi:hypothetical protein